MPTVSIIIPVYNVEKLLPRCLDSIFGQTYQDFEVICVNDCTPDDSKTVLEAYKERYPERMVLLDNEVNMGQGRSRARGIDIAKGEYILFIDSDDHVAEDYIETYLKEMEAHPCDVVVGGYSENVASPAEGMSASLEDLEVRRTMDAPRGDWCILSYPTPWAKLFRRSFLVDNKINFSDIRVGEDIYFSTSQFYHQATYHVFDYYGYYYYFNINSTTKTLTYDRKHEENVAEIFGKFLRDHDLCLVSKEQREMIEYIYVANMVNALVTYGHGCKPAKMKEKYAFFMKDMREKFPDYKKNRYYGLLKPEGQTLKIRLGVGVTMMLHKVGLDKLMFYVISLI